MYVCMYVCRTGPTCFRRECMQPMCPESRSHVPEMLSGSVSWETQLSQFFLQISRTVEPTKVVISDRFGVIFDVISFKNGAEWICEAPRYQDGAQEATKGPELSPKSHLFGYPFWTLGLTFRVPFFEGFSGTLPERLLSDFGPQKASKREAFGGPFGDLFRKHEKCDF